MQIVLFLPPCFFAMMSTTYHTFLVRDLEIQYGNCCFAVSSDFGLDVEDYLIGESSKCVLGYH